MPDPAPRPAPHPAEPQRDPARRDLDRRDSARPDSAPPPWLRTSAGWSWRLILLVAGIALVFWAVTRVLIVFVAVFLALVFTAVLNPLTDLYARVMPRALATAASILSAILVVGGLVTYVVVSVAGQWERLAGEFNTGIDQIVGLIENNSLPLNVQVDTRDQWIDDAARWIQENAQTLVGRAAESAGSIVEGIAVLALSIFCTVFFLASGGAMWRWFMQQVPARTRGRWSDAADVGWYTFSGYTRGTVLVAITNGILAGIFLSILGVPLSAPLAVLVFIGTFIPLIGAPLAMIIAAVVALAADGLLTALIVTLGIAGIGQLEGHVLQPLIMGKQVSLHPVVVALGVTCGTVVGGILGAIVAVPLIAVAWAVYSTLRKPVDAGADAGTGPGGTGDVGPDRDEPGAEGAAKA
ncbi:AI-2E family transporter [Promicromonospora sukumoe]|uniref:Putative PurR-regulated permease PerM n=1 Tax=Promicromonospora sukumoe TaxID=88382 RepID=A0A7W3J7Y0_9MICO|nr:putative PurR-regulated permease PerM [Promicromonospora sukumoe]